MMISQAKSITQAPATARAGLSASASAPRRAAQAQAEANLLIHASAERVWQLLVDIDRWPSWNPAVQSARLEGGLAVGSLFKWKSKGFSVTSTLQDLEPAVRLRWTGRAFGTTADHTWTIERTTDGVLVRTTESFGGWLPWLLRGSMRKTLDETLPAWLEALRLAAERHSETAVVEMTTAMAQVPS